MYPDPARGGAACKPDIWISAAFAMCVYIYSHSFEDFAFIAGSIQLQPHMILTQ